MELGFTLGLLLNHKQKGSFSKNTSGLFCGLPLNDTTNNKKGTIKKNTKAYGGVFQNGGTPPKSYKKGVAWKTPRNRKHLDSI